jgi:hypothetical protein
MKKIFVPLIAAAAFLASCEPTDPHGDNDEEVITTVTVDLVADSATVQFSYVDLDGDGGDAPTITADNLQANTTYTGTITLLNESETPAEDITAEVQAEDEDHQFFFSHGANITTTYTDQDGNGNPVGLEFTLVTGDAGSESFTVILRHEPDKTGMGVADGDITNAGGETDIDVTFTFDIE